ncbi:MAG: threonine--tRNA ligase [Dehalococcoidia bacterium]|nr:threonine--tRNA ligase [Dehalococcoidia bacterium]
MPEPSEMAAQDRLHRMRHSAAHIMAEAVMEMFPQAKLGIGPPIDTGFYYDFELPRPLSTEDLPVIEEKMRARIGSDVPFEPSQISKEDARKLFHDQPYKLELIDGIEDEAVGLYRQGEFLDLCQGPHVQRTGQVAPFKLMSVAGAYWRGSERNPMLQRIYGALFETQEELDAHLQQIEEALRRDHRRLGRELDLFSFHEEFGPGLVYWHPRGGRVRTLIEDFWRREHYRAGYELVYTPHIGKSTLWETSGHLDFYTENMYSPMDIDGQDYYVRPMNCPFHIQIYKSDLHSYRELPIRLAELGTVYRYERSGVLHGLMRVRGFTQDDAHILCRPDQVRAEIQGCVDFMLFFLGAFGFQDFHVYLSTRDESGKYAGSLEDWQMATEVLRDVIQERKLTYDVDEGGAVFYGPKIDVKMIDALGREWQCTTIQFDFNLPERFDVTYIGEDGREHRPYMVHRALLGSMERFFGVLIEHYAGAFPMWLAPVQGVLIPIADRHVPYAQQVAADMRSAGLRVDVDERNERMQAKIRDAQLQKVPYMLVVGDREQEAGAAAVRLRSGEDLKAMPVAEIIERMLREAGEKA